MHPNDQLRAVSDANDKATLTSTLEELSTYICIGMEDYIRAFDPNKGITVLLRVAKSNKDEDVLTLVYRTMALVLEYVPRSAEALVGSGVVPTLVAGLKGCYNQDMIEEMLRVLKQVSVDDSTGVLLQAGAIPAIVASMDSQDRRLHPTSLNVIENVVIKINLDPATPAKSSKAKKLFTKSSAASTASSSGSASQQVVSNVVKKHILPCLAGMMESLGVQDLDQGSAREVAVALCSCAVTVVERCHRTVPDIVAAAAATGLFSQLVGLLHAATQQNDQRQASAALKTLGTLSSISPNATAAPLLENPVLHPILRDLLAPEQQDFSSILKDPYGLEKEQERVSGAGPGKSSVDLKSDALYLLYCLAPRIPPSLLTLQSPPIRRLHAWEWEDDYHALNPYEMEASKVLERALQDGLPQATISARGQSYTIDLNSMKQLNPASGGARNVRRHPLPVAYLRMPEAISAAPAGKAEGAGGGSPASSSTTSSPLLGRKTSRRSVPDKDSGKEKDAKAAAAKEKEKSLSSSVKSKSSEPAILKNTAIRSDSVYASEKGAQLAKKLFSIGAGPLAQFAVQCGDPHKREWAAETLAKVMHGTVAALKLKGGNWAVASEELLQAAPALAPCLITLLGKGIDEPGLLDHALTTVELLAAIGTSAAIPQQLRKGGLQEALSGVISQSKSLPQRLCARVSSFVSSYLSASGPHGGEALLGALAKELGKGSPGVMKKVLVEIRRLETEVCHGDLVSSDLPSAVLAWLAPDDATLRHARGCDFADSLRDNPEGALALTVLLKQSVVAIESLPSSVAIDRAEPSSERTQSAPKKQRIGSSAPQSMPAPATIPAPGAPATKAAQPSEFLRALGKKSFRISFDPCPVKDKEPQSSSSAEQPSAKVITVDPLATVGCIERFLCGVQVAGGELPTGNGMRVLTGSSARHMLDSLATTGENVLEDLLKRIEEEHGLDELMDDDEDDDDDMFGDGHEVVIVDNTRMSVYDEPRKSVAPRTAPLQPPHPSSPSSPAAPLNTACPLVPDGATEAPLAPPVLYDFAVSGINGLPKTAPMIEVVRRYCEKHNPKGLAQLEGLLNPPAIPTEGSELASRERKVGSLRAKLQRVQAKPGKPDEKRKKEEQEYKAKLETATQKLAELKRSTGESVWDLVIPISWKKASRHAVTTEMPAVLSSQGEVLLWKIDEALRGESSDILARSVRDPAMLSLLQLLRVVYLVTSSQPSPLIPLKAFQCPHLSGKLMQTLATNACRVALFGSRGVPQWCTILPTACDFLFPIGARRESVCFVTSGALKSLVQFVKLRNRIPHSDVIQPEILPAYGQPRMKVDRLCLETKANDLLSATTWRRLPLEVQYEGEEGTGLGPTLEFFTIVSHELLATSRHMWKGEDKGGYIMPPAAGAYPSPVPVSASPAELEQDVARFELLGRLAGRALMDGRLLDIPLSPVFLRLAQHWHRLHSMAYLTVDDVVSVDPSLGKSLQYFVDFSTKYDAEMDPSAKEKLAKEAGLSPADEGFYHFTMPGEDEYPLKPGGESIPVTCHNVREFIYLAVEKIMFESVRDRIAAFMQGFEETLPTEALQSCNEYELSELLCGLNVRNEPLWTADELAATIVADHGYSSESKVIQELIDILCHEFTPAEQREFLSWTTGCPRLPIGGITSVGKITVVKKTDAEQGADEAHLPSCNTCFRYLKLPTYPSKKILADKLRQAISEGSGSFSLS
ncbi:E3 ubiquitin-protein ligase UPL3 [Diplonema papillatum]|nr:E3 ubiquitin-protein ligase UPL3 [Diplonema papillatum]